MSAKPYPSRLDPSLTETTRRRDGYRIIRYRRVGDDWLPSVTTIWIGADPNPMPRFHLFTRRTQ